MQYSGRMRSHLANSPIADGFPGAKRLTLSSRKPEAGHWRVRNDVELPAMLVFVLHVEVWLGCLHKGANRSESCPESANITVL